MCLVILNEEIVKHYEQNGFDWLNIMNPVEKVENLTSIIEQACQENEYMFMADSLEELSDKTGINLAALKKTVDEYNKVCETGRDEIFYKNPKYLRPIKQPKYFAGRFYPTAYGSLGGIKINYKTEVLTEDHEVIPGLYAAGVDANAIYVDSYVFILPGNTMAFALNSGRIAGENAAEYIKSVK